MKYETFTRNDALVFKPEHLKEARRDRETVLAIPTELYQRLMDTLEGRAANAPESAWNEKNELAELHPDPVINELLSVIFTVERRQDAWIVAFNLTVSAASREEALEVATSAVDQALLLKLQTAWVGESRDAN